MALQIKVEFRRVRYITIDYSSGWTVTASVRVVSSLREEANVVALAHHDHCDLRGHFVVRQSPCKTNDEYVRP